MEFVVLLVVLFALNAISQAVQKNKGKGRPQRPVRQRPRERVASRAGEVAGRKQPQSIKDLLDEFRRAMEEAERGSKGEDVVVLEPPTPVEDEYDDEDLDAIEERETLEVVPVPKSIEVPARLTERRVVDLDDEAEEVIRERLEWAEEHARGRRPGEHAAFDARIRKKKAEPESHETAPPDLRQAIIWREVLGPPVSLRDDYSE